MSFSEQIINVLFKPGKYKDVLALHKKRFSRYVMVLCLVLSLMTFAVPAIATIAGVGGLTNLFKTNLKSFTYSHGVASMDNVFKLKFQGTTLIIDTSKPEVDITQIKEDISYISVGSEKISIGSYIDGKDYVVAKYKLSDFFTFRVDSGTLIKHIPFIYGYLFLMFICKAIFHFFEYAIYAILLVLLFKLMRKSALGQYKFGFLFKVCFYAESLMMLISAFNSDIRLVPATIVTLIGAFYTIRMATLALASYSEAEQ